MFTEITLRYVGGGVVEVVADGKRLLTIHDQATVIRVVRTLLEEGKALGF